MPTMHYVRGRETGLSQRVLLATQASDGRPQVNFLRALVESLPALKDAGWAYDFAIEAGNCHVDDARNAIVRQFMQTDCTDLLFIDADVGWSVEGLIQLLSHDTDLVAGVYPKKQDDPLDFPVRALPGERWADNGLVEVEGAPTGFMRIRRPCLERLIEAHKDRQFIGSDGGEPYTILFERTFEGGHRWSGDYAFCRKWRAIGGKVFIDPEIDFSHAGEKQWTGRLGDHWRKEAGVINPKLKEALSKLPDPDAFAKAYNAWGRVYAAPPGFLQAAHTLAKRAKGPVLETGSGLSTIVMGLTGAEVHSLEHDIGYLRETRKLAADFGLENVHVHYAPLDPETGWYTVPADLPEKFAVVLCDGPPRAHADRSVIWAALEDRIYDADWLIDDTRGDTVAGRKCECVEDIHPWVYAKRV
jgi:hypothetical protein